MLPRATAAGCSGFCRAAAHNSPFAAAIIWLPPVMSPARAILAAGRSDVGDPFHIVALSSGRSADDLILAAADLLPAGSNITNAIGDAFAIKGTGRGGHDRLIGNVSLDRLTGDAVEMRGHAIGGNDFLSGNGGVGRSYRRRRRDGRQRPWRQRYPVRRRR